MKTKLMTLVTAFAVVTTFSNCNKAEVELGAADPTPTVAPEIEAVLTTTEPASAVSVSDARKAPEVGKTLTVTGKIGGSEYPFTKGFAMVVLSDVSLETCDSMEEDPCLTPWDACCVEPEVISASRLMIQVVGEDGRPVAQTLKGVAGIKELDVLVVTGKVAEGSSKDNLVINVEEMFRK